jgi:hypothetical protein
MKIVFSRKGFDSASGGCPSPIFPDGSLFALPIPDERSPVRYRDLTWNGRSVGELVERLTRGKVRGADGAHLDPDLRPEQLPREPGWRPVLGQCSAAQGHLRNQCVGPGDLFLFWGVFREVDVQLRWRGPPVHVIWGWLQVGEVGAVDRDVRTDLARWGWAARHPHLAFQPDATNALYVAADRVAGTELPGAGTFSAVAGPLRLSAEGAPRPTLWSVPSWMAPRGRAALTYHDAPERWTERDGGVLLQTVARGQEFVLDAECYPEVAKWAIGLIRAGREACKRHEAEQSSRDASPAVKGRGAGGT